jgi:hypothetical protein
MKKLLLVAVLVAVACGGDKEVKNGGGDNAPEWLSLGNGTVTAESGKKMLAVGSSNAQDPKARRKAADAAAQAQLDTELATLATALTKMSESTQDNLGDAVAAMTKKAASFSAQIRDHYVGGDGNEMSLEILELGAFTNAITAGDGDDKLKKEIAGNAPKAFDQLAIKQ